MGFDMSISKIESNASNYKNKIKQELDIFQNQVEIHDLPAIFHYWADKFIKPLLEDLNYNSIEDFFSKNFYECYCRSDSTIRHFLSIGSGNCDLEISIAKSLLHLGCSDFIIECLELNPIMLSRGIELATANNVAEFMRFSEADFNKWTATKIYSGVMAHHSLHHVTELEHLFNEIRLNLHPYGAFAICDMIGRNGHQRWPESLEVVNRYWSELPASYRYNTLLNRYEDKYENWDCSKEGFEGIRAQDILPLLLQRFSCEKFIGFGSAIDVFVSRCFGSNFDVNVQWDKEFIERVHQTDEEYIKNGILTPTSMFAVFRPTPVSKHFYSRNISPNMSIRRIESTLTANDSNTCDNFKILNWGPQATYQGIIPNIQPDGGAGIWIEVLGEQTLNEVQVIFENRPATVTSIQQGLITASISELEFRQLGTKSISIKDLTNDKILPVGVFNVQSVEDDALYLDNMNQYISEFASKLNTLKPIIESNTFKWYGFDVFGNLIHISMLLANNYKDIFVREKHLPIADIGYNDGDISFFLESLGCIVDNINWLQANWNGLKGLNLLKNRLDSNISINEIDLNSSISFPREEYGMTLLLDVLCHTKNPIYVLESLSKVSHYSLINTRVMKFATDRTRRLDDLSVAYLLSPDECQNDSTNYWVFSVSGLKTILNRSGWDVLELITVGDTTDSDPYSPERDERAFVLVKSRHFTNANPV